MIREAPRIETERLVLRGWRKQDFRPWFDILQEGAVGRFLGGTGTTLEDVWRRLSGAAGSWPMLGFGGWAVTARDDGALIGNVGLFNAWRDFEPQFGEEPEMGWIFSTRTHGQGLASEAAHVALAWAEASLEPTPIWAIIAPENHSSFRLAERLGFERVAETLYNNEPTAVLRRPAWLPAAAAAATAAATR
ncbi:MAG: GNAT family N-acetyltransferase [Pseudomonadota bacterium]|nr:GNAT family N-acetyltransferase [Sphingomonas sp.]MDQ3477671.1 GNAT family N-acetyltransferase [Pseudomonadota bacterium]